MLRLASSPQSAQRVLLLAPLVFLLSLIAQFAPLQSLAATSVATGSGFFVSADGLLVTNFHVIDGATRIEVIIGNEPPRLARVLKVDRANDLAVLRVAGGSRPVRIASSDLVRRGERVYAIGFPQIDIQGVEPKLTDGVVSSLSGIRDSPAHFQISNPIQPGNSGGPLFLDDGRVVGVVVSTLNATKVLAQTGSLPQNVNYAIKSNYLLELLRLVSPQISATAAPRQKRDIVQVVSEVEKSLGLVVAYVDERAAESRPAPAQRAPQPPRSDPRPPRAEPTPPLQPVPSPSPLPVPHAVTGTIHWQLAAAYPAGNPHTQNLSQFASDIAKATGGRLNISVHPGGALFRASEIKRAVQAGAAPIGEVLMSLLETEHPAFGADSIPFVAAGFGPAFRLWQAQKPSIEKILAGQGIKLLYAVAWPPQGIYSKKQLNSIADMKGLKWRAYNPATRRIAQLVGAQPLTVQAAELSQALATGVVDSFMTSGATGVDAKVWESLTHFAATDAWLPKNMVIVNQKEFDKLDKATQDAVLAAAKASEERGWALMREYTSQATVMLRANGVTVYEPTPQLRAELADIGELMLTEWLKNAGAEGESIIRRFRN